MSVAHSTSKTERRCWSRVAEELLMTCREKDSLCERAYFTRNLSGGGCMFESPEAIPLRTAVELALYAPVDCERRTRVYVVLAARVQWISEMPTAGRDTWSNRYRIGVAFEAGDSQDRKCLSEYVERKHRMVCAH